MEDNYLKYYIQRSIKEEKLKLKRVDLFEDEKYKDIFNYTLQNYMAEKYPEELGPGNITPMFCYVAIGNNESYYIYTCYNRKQKKNVIFVFSCESSEFNILNFKECFNTELDDEFFKEIRIMTDNQKNN